MASRLLAGLASMAALAAGVAGCGGEEQGDAATALPPTTSWVAGQGSLRLAPAYLAIASRADELGERRLASYVHEIERIDAAKRAAKRKARAEAMRKYREALRRAREKYQQALRRAAAERERLEAEARLRRIEAAARMRELLKKLRVPTGEECKIPEVARQLDCVSGRLPIGKRKE